MEALGIVSLNALTKEADEYPNVLRNLEEADYFALVDMRDPSLRQEVLFEVKHFLLVVA